MGKQKLQCGPLALLNSGQGFDIVFNVSSESLNPCSTSTPQMQALIILDENRSLLIIYLLLALAQTDW
jgi:hypothetical protein